MTDKLFHTQEYLFDAKSIIHLLVTLLDWIIIRGEKYNIVEIRIKPTQSGWKAELYYWVKA